MTHYLGCLSTLLFINLLNLTSVPIPGVNESFLNAHVSNVTCSSVELSGIRSGWVNDSSYASTTDGGSLRCYANLTAYAYVGVMSADVQVQSSEVRLARTVRNPRDDWCLTEASSVEVCRLNATVENLSAHPPSRLIDALLRKIQIYFNSNLSRYICGVLIPRLQADMLNRTLPYVPEREDREDDDTKIVALTEVPLTRAAANIAADLSSSGATTITVDLRRQRISLKVRVPRWGAAFAGDVVPTDPSQDAVAWAQSLVDAYVNGKAPHPFPVYGVHGWIGELLVEAKTTNAVTVALDLDVSAASFGGNWVSIYLDRGVSVANLQIETEGNSGLDVLLTREVGPYVEAALNAKIAALLGSLTSLPRASGSADEGAETATFSFGHNAVAIDTPRKLPLFLLSVVGVPAGAFLVHRNVRRHKMNPVLQRATGTPVSVARIVMEDVFLVGGVLSCLLLFAASNTMTGATVVIGKTLHTYAFSLRNTVTDLWSAGLIPLSVCVLLFSGVYPYFKLLSIVAFTVGAQRPSSTVLAFIDSLGKFSLIDTFALIVMVSGLEIHSVAVVEIHQSFYFFMYATVASIALGNYATQLWRFGTTVRAGADDTLISSPNTYTQVGTSEPTAAPAPLEEPPLTNRELTVGEALVPAESDPWWCRWSRAHFGQARFLLLPVCSLPAWIWPSLEYRIGGFARLLTPPTKSLSLWQLSTLNGRGGTTGLCLVTVFTVLIAPCVYAVFHPRAPFVASWCAADVFMVACVAGLLQLHQFVTFVLGEDMSEVYTAHASLLWPLFLLTTAALVVWYHLAGELLPRGTGFKASQRSENDSRE